jgi:hypothetical protein
MNMQKYKFEDDSHVDFFAALKEMQTNEVSDTIGGGGAAAEEPTCLITGQPLNACHVKLPCGHQFNYEPLYQEVMRQKGRFGWNNYHEKLNLYQVKCPYCRCIANQLLPYIDNNLHPVIKRLTGINAPAFACMPGTPCENDNCNSNAFCEHNESVYCYKHYQKALNPKPVSRPKAKKTNATNATNATDATNATNATNATTSRCVAENQSGKNKGKQCKLMASSGSMLCKIHAKCNMIMAVGTVLL